MSETAEQQRIRTASARLIEKAIPRIQQILRERILMGGESLAPDGVFLNPTFRETWDARERRVRKLLSNLQTLLGRLSAPLPPEWWTDQTSITHLTIFESAGELGSHVFRFHAHLLAQTPAGYDLMDDDAVGRFLQAACHPHWGPGRAVSTGINISVADPYLNPQAYLRLTGTVSPIGTIYEVLRDWQGRYFYNFHSRRQYLLHAP